MNLNHKRLLIFYPSNKRSIAMESMVRGLKNMGINILFLTLAEKGSIHTTLNRYNIRTFSSTNLFRSGVIRYTINLFRLILFIYRYKIDVVHSHLQDSNILAVIAQFFVPVKIIIFRHHFNLHSLFDPDIKRNRNEIFGEKIINKLAKTIIVPSESIYQAILTNEKVSPTKLFVIPYTYDFDAYPKPNKNIVENLRNKYPAKLRLLMCSRYIKAKRHDLAFKVIHEILKQEKLDLILFSLDDGPEFEKMKEYVVKNDLQNQIILTGYKYNVIDYMELCDILIHPSLYEASNSVVKEMGYMSKSVIVMEGVGDFNEYIENYWNGFTLNHGNTFNDLKEIIISIYYENIDVKKLGENLKNTVMEKYGIKSEFVEKYLKYV